MTAQTVWLYVRMVILYICTYVHTYVSYQFICCYVCALIYMYMMIVTYDIILLPHAICVINYVFCVGGSKGQNVLYFP